MACSANLRLQERARLRSLLHPGYIVQVSGPPMVGKLTIVRQVLVNMQQESRLQNSLSPVSCAGSFMFHHFPCKGKRTIPDVVGVMASHLENSSHPVEHLVWAIQSLQHQHHIIVFENCESLVSESNDYTFLNFLKYLNQRFLTQCVTIVFTSYKRFEWPGSQPHIKERMVIGPLHDDFGNICSTLEIGPLSDEDILAALWHFAPNVNPNPYLQVFQQHLGFPDVVRRVAETFLNIGTNGQNGATAISAEMLAQRVKSDMSFLHSIFSPRISEVIEWVGSQNLLLLSHVGSSIDASLTREGYNSIATDGRDPFLYRTIIYALERYYVIRELPCTRRLVVHPLVVYFCCTQLRQRQIAFRERDAPLFSKRFAQFLCRTLSTLDACRQLRGQQLKFVVNVLHETPNIRHVIEDALHSNGDNFDTYFTLAVQGSRMLSHICPREVTQFFSYLHECSVSEQRSEVEQAVLMGLCGQALAWGSGNWQDAVVKLRSAIDVLSRPGIPTSFYLFIFLTEMARVLARLSLYQESLRCFRRARGVSEQVKVNAFGGRLAVTESRLFEANLHLALFETVPLIFIGQNSRARARLLNLKDQMQQHFPCSLEVAMVDNQLGLTSQRGFLRNDEAIGLYSNSLRVRLFFQRINPIPLYAPLNNVAMLCFRRRDFDQFYQHLQMALQISRDHGWTNYYTGLSLIHLAEGSIPLGLYESALVYLKEGERILEMTSPQHDLRLRVFLELAHVRVALYQSGREEVLRRWFSTPEYLLNQQQPAGNSADLRDAQIKDGLLVPGARDMCDPANPSDLDMTPRDHLDRVVHLITESRGTLSDDGHHYLLSTYEHALVLHWGDPQRFDEFKDKIFEHVSQNDFIGELFQQEKKRQYGHVNLYKHRPVYLYLKDCAEGRQQLTLPHFLSLMLPTCTVCTSCKDYGLQNDFFSANLWCREVNGAEVNRRRKEHIIDQVSYVPEEFRWSVPNDQCLFSPSVREMKVSSNQSEDEPQQIIAKQRDSNEDPSRRTMDDICGENQQFMNTEQISHKVVANAVERSKCPTSSTGIETSSLRLDSKGLLANLPNFNMLVSASDSKFQSHNEISPVPNSQLSLWKSQTNTSSSLGVGTVVVDLPPSRREPTEDEEYRGSTGYTDSKDCAGHRELALQERDNTLGNPADGNSSEFTSSGFSSLEYNNAQSGSSTVSGRTQLDNSKNRSQKPLDLTLTQLQNVPMLDVLEP